VSNSRFYAYAEAKHGNLKFQNAAAAGKEVAPSLGSARSIAQQVDVQPA
jgi:hypothetical protein